MAMIGLIFFALLTYKKFFCGNTFSKKSSFLNIEETINLAPRKSLYVIRAGNEKFLIASDSDRTSLISKLDETQKIKRADVNYEELPVIVDFPKKTEQPIIKEMMKKINQI